MWEPHEKDWAEKPLEDWQLIIQGQIATFLTDTNIEEPASSFSSFNFILMYKEKEEKISLVVCRRIGADKNIKVNCLSPNESLELFQSCLAEDTLNTPKIRGLSTTLAAMCHGLPLVLVVVGRAMAHNKNPKQWNTAIENAKRHPSNVPGMENEVFPVLRISYDSLSNGRMKECFLYFATYWEARFIRKRDLIEQWMAEGIFGESCDIKEVRRDGEYIIECLKLAYLVEIDESEEFVSLHDVFHSMALWLCCESRCESAVKRILVQENAIEFHKWMDTERILLWGSNIKSLTGIELITERPSFHQLKTLVVGFTELKKFPDKFFLCTPALRVLDLLGNANLEELPVSIGELKELRYLCLNRTKIYKLRDEVKKLTKLEILLLDDAFITDKSSWEAIAFLSSLQVLSVRVRWTNFLESYVDEEIGFLQMLNCLENIKEISIPLLSYQSIKEVLNSAKLRNSIRLAVLLEMDPRCINHCVLMLRSLENLGRLYIRPLKLQLGPIDDEDLEGPVLPNYPSPSNPQLDQCLHFQNLVDVYIWSCPIKNANWLIYAPNLEILKILYCDQMIELIGQDEDNLEVFANLRKLYLTGLVNLMRLCRKALPLDCLVKVSVKCCPYLCELPFDSSSAMNLREIKGEKSWWESLVWNTESLPQRLFQSFVPYHDLQGSSD